MIDSLVKNETKAYAKIRFSHFFNVLALTSTICWPIPLFDASFGFQKYQNRFNQKIFVEKNLAVKKILLWT